MKFIFLTPATIEHELVDELTDILISCENGSIPSIQGVEFHKATVVTTVDTTTAPLSDVYFPSVTICNINQVRERPATFTFAIVGVVIGRESWKGINPLT